MLAKLLSRQTPEPAEVDETNTDYETLKRRIDSILSRPVRRIHEDLVKRASTDEETSEDEMARMANEAGSGDLRQEGKNAKAAKPGESSSETGAVLEEDSANAPSRAGEQSSLKESEKRGSAPEEGEEAQESTEADMAAWQVDQSETDTLASPETIEESSGSTKGSEAAVETKPGDTNAGLQVAKGKSLKTILLSQSSYKSKNSVDAIDITGQVLDYLMTQKGYGPKDVPKAAFEACAMDFYIQTVLEEGHAAYYQTVTEQPVLVDAACKGFAAIKAEEYLTILEQFLSHFVETKDDPDALGILDGELRRLEKRHSLSPRIGEWLKTQPEVEVVADDDLMNRLSELLKQAEIAAS